MVGEPSSLINSHHRASAQRKRPFDQAVPALVKAILTQQVGKGGKPVRDDLHLFIEQQRRVVLADHLCSTQRITFKLLLHLLDAHLVIMEVGAMPSKPFAGSLDVLPVTLVDQAVALLFKPPVLSCSRFRCSPAHPPLPAVGHALHKGLIAIFQRVHAVNVGCAIVQTARPQLCALRPIRPC